MTGGITDATRTYRLAYTLSRSDFADASQVRFKHNVAKTSFRIVGICLSFLFVWVGISNVFSDMLNSVVALVFGLAGLIILGFMPFYWQQKVARLQADKELSLAVSKQGVQADLGDGLVGPTWVHYVRKELSSKGIMLFFLRGKDIWIPARVFRDAQEMDGFSSFIDTAAFELAEEFRKARETMKAERG